MKEQRPKAKPLQRRTAPSTALQRAPAAGAQSGIGNARLGAMPRCARESLLQIRRAPAPSGQDQLLTKSKRSASKADKQHPARSKQTVSHQMGGTVCLTFDDGPFPETLAVLSVLKAENVPAAFFLIGGAPDPKSKGEDIGRSMNATQLRALKEIMLNPLFRAESHGFSHQTAGGRQYKKRYGDSSDQGNYQALKFGKGKKEKFRENLNRNEQFFRAEAAKIADLPSTTEDERKRLLAWKGFGLVRLPGDGRNITELVNAVREAGKNHVGWSFEIAPESSKLMRKDGVVPKYRNPILDWEKMTGIDVEAPAGIVLGRSTIVLLHDKHWRNVEKLKEVIAKLRAMGLQFGALNDEGECPNLPMLGQRDATSDASPPSLRDASSQIASSQILPQLEVGRIDDPSEREAEDFTRRVMHMSVGGACCSACPTGGPCVSHAGEIEQGQVGPVRRQPSGSSDGLTVSEDLERQVRRATTGGEALPGVVRTFFEPRFGQDLSHVRIHRDATAAESASVLGARAYTLGDHIAFASGRWAPGTEAGDRLIAHELTHVLQQDAPGRVAAGPIRRDPASERDVKRVISREALAQQRHLEAVEAQLEKFLEKRRSGVRSLLVELGPDPKSARAKERARRLREDFDKDLATIRKRSDSKPVHPGLRTDIVRSARALEAARNKLNSLNMQWTKYDAVFAGKEVAAKLGTGLTPAQLKALIAQESYDLTRNEVKGDKVGVAQMGSAEAKEAGGAPDDRKVPEKAIPLAATRLAGVAGHLDKSMKAKVTGIERARFIMAAYNGGANLIIIAQRFAIEMKRDGKTWQSLIEGEKDSPLYRALKATYRAGTEDGKFKEITKYVHNIEARLSPDPDFWP